MNLSLLLLIPTVALGYDALRYVKLTVPTTPEQKHCFGETVEEGVKEIQIDFRCEEGNGVTMIVRADGEAICHRIDRRGSWLVKNPKFKSYEVCFSEAQKSFTFTVWHLKEKDLIDEKNLEKMSDEIVQKLGPIAIPIAELSSRLDAVSTNLRRAHETQMEFRVFDKSDIDLAVEVSNGVNFWSTFVTSYFVFISIGFVFAVRALFDDGSRVGKFLRKGKLD